MLKIKLSRVGKKNQPIYRIVVVEAKAKLNGRHLRNIGFYNPLTKPPIIKIDKQALNEWLNKGAQPTPRVKKLIAGIK